MSRDNLNCGGWIYVEKSYCPDKIIWGGVIKNEADKSPTFNKTFCDSQNSSDRSRAKRFSATVKLAKGTRSACVINPDRITRKLNVVIRNKQIERNVYPTGPYFRVRMWATLFGQRVVVVFLRREAWRGKHANSLNRSKKFRGNNVSQCVPCISNEYKGVSKHFRAVPRIKNDSERSSSISTSI